MNAVQTSEQVIKKVHVEASVLFAINHIPNVDAHTLERYLELVNLTGTFGSISQEELLQKMNLLIKHIPETCEHSLSTVGELLGINFPVQTESSKVVGRIGPAYEIEPQQMAVTQ